MSEGNIHYENPFATPLDKREPGRRLRGRLAAPVTVWTSGTLPSGTGLTISSIVLAEGRPSMILGLMNETTDVFEIIRTTGSFVVHVLDYSDRVLADRFAGLRPSPGGLFAGLEVAESDWGPILSDVTNRAYCRFADESPAGYQRLVRGEIEKIDLEELATPLVYFRGRYRPLEPGEET